MVLEGLRSISYRGYFRRGKRPIESVNMGGFANDIPALCLAYGNSTERLEARSLPAGVCQSRI